MRFPVDNLIPQDYNKPIIQAERSDSDDVQSFLQHGNDEYFCVRSQCEFHLALAVEDMEKAHALHEKLGCICYENPAMGIYFISDPDGYWIEIIPTK